MLRLVLSVLVVVALVVPAGGGANSNATVTLDLVADSGAGNQIDDGVLSGAVSGRGSKIVVEVFVKGVVTTLRAFSVVFHFDPSVLKFDRAENRAFIFRLQYMGTSIRRASTEPVTLPKSGFILRAEFSTVIDVTDKEFSLGIATVSLDESLEKADLVTTENRIWFNRNKPITAADADFDGSGEVNFTDFLLFAQAFGSTISKYDLDTSGKVDFPDFLAFVDVFGQKVQAVPEGSVDGDRAALVALYNAANGDNWKDNTNWLSDKPLDQWHGVTTNEQGRVLGLNLWSNRLSGSIPPELGNLSKLVLLELGLNRLSGVIPLELGDLPRLAWLGLRETLNLCMPSALKDWRHYNTYGASKCDE